MDGDVRARWIEALPKGVSKWTSLAEIDREYTLNEIATMTRAAPARLLGTSDRGHLGAGANADVSVYRRHDDKAKMFGAAAYLFKDGVKVVENGAVIAKPYGRALTLKTQSDARMGARLDTYFDDAYGLKSSWFKVEGSALRRQAPFREVPCL